jgi:MFS family permease
VLVDALSFLGSGLFVLSIRNRIEPHVAIAAVSDKPSLWTELKEGLRFVLGNPYLRAQAGCTATSNFFFSLAFSIILVYYVRVLDLSPGVIGIVFSIGSIGSLVAAVTTGRLTGQFGVGQTTLAASFLEGPALLLIALAPVAAPIPFLIVSGLLAGFVIVVYNINQVSFRQAICPERLQGRMNSVMRFIVWGTIPLGNLSGGALATWIGLRETIVVGAVGAASAFLWILFSPMRSVRAMPTGPMDVSAEPARA